MNETDVDSHWSRDPKRPRPWHCVTATLVYSLVVLSAVSICAEGTRPSDLVGGRNLHSVDPSASPVMVEKVVYVPIYPSLYSGSASARAIPVHVTLSLRNVSDKSTVSVLRADLYDGDGQRIRALIEAPHDLGPMQTADFVVSRPGSGGSGASIRVMWGLRDPGPDLLVEAVMRGYDGDAGVSFTTRGHLVSEGADDGGPFARG